MAETTSPPPSPYAPGIIAEERRPPRPAGRPVVFLIAIFVMALVTDTSLWWESACRSTSVGGRARGIIDLVDRDVWVANLLIAVWAYLSDRVAVWGTRREGYLLVCGLTMAITWLVLAVLGTHDVAWVLAVVAFGLAITVTRAVVSGGLAEIGQRRAATGRLAAAFVVATRIASVAAGPLAAGLASAPLPVLPGIAAALSAAVVILIITLSDEDNPPPEGPAIAPVTVWRFLRSRTFWSAGAFLSIASLTIVPRDLVASHIWATQSGSMNDAWSKLDWIGSAARIAAALGYLFICRRLSLRAVLRIGLLAEAVVLIASARTLQFGAGAALDVAVAAVAICHGIVIIGAFDLVLRAAPRGREAFGTILLSVLPALPGGFVGYFANRLEAKAASMAWFAAAAAIAGVLAVSLLPRALVAPRDGERTAAQ